MQIGSADLTDEGALRGLLDRAALFDLHARYFQGLDSGREAQVRGCFLPDVRAIYHNRPEAVGLEALMADSLTPFFQRLASRHTRIATHFMGNVVFERIDGDVAETEVYAIAFGVRARAVLLLAEARRRRNGMAPLLRLTSAPQLLPHADVGASGAPLALFFASKLGDWRARVRGSRSRSR